MIQIGNCLELAKALPDNCIDTIVTSPPYWGLRDYGVKDAWGLEPTFAEYLSKVESLFAELLRALKPTGTCWVNMGDSYANIGKGGGSGGCKNYTSVAGGYDRTERRGAFDGLKIKQKDLVGQPWRVAFMLQDQGWYLRQEIIWHKPNPMPESVRDRCTKSHEQIFLLTKRPKYYFDQDSIRTQFSPETKQLSHDTMDYKRRDGYKMPDGWDTGAGSHGTIHRNGREKGAPASHKRSRFDTGKTGDHQLGRVSKNQRSDQRTKENLNANWESSEANGEVKGANCRTVWSIATEAYPDAHFATFPTEIPRRCISAGSPEGGLVLDPFAGSGTTLMVAKQLGRHYLGFEINPKYAAMAERRIANVTPSMFTEAAS